MLRMGNKGQVNALVGGVIAVYIALIVIFSLNTAAFDTVTLALFGLLGVVVIGAFITRIL